MNVISSANMIPGQPWSIVAAMTLTFVSVAIAATRIRARRGSSSRHPQRMYTAQQRNIGMSRAQNQCEYDRWWLWRCTRTAEHGDHFWPWSKGGATTMQNYVAACSRCNTSKGAKVPTPLQRMRIESRRRAYFPPGVPVTVGEWTTH